MIIPRADVLDLAEWLSDIHHCSTAASHLLYRMSIKRWVQRAMMPSNCKSKRHTSSFDVFYYLLTYKHIWSYKKVTLLWKFSLWKVKVSDLTRFFFCINDREIQGNNPPKCNGHTFHTKEPCLFSNNFSSIYCWFVLVSLDSW